MKVAVRSDELSTCSFGVASVWYRVAPEDVLPIVVTLGESWETHLVMYEESPSGLTPLGCSDDRLMLPPASERGDYLIQVMSETPSSGFELAVRRGVLVQGAGIVGASEVAAEEGPSADAWASAWPVWMSARVGQDGAGVCFGVLVGTCVGI